MRVHVRGPASLFAVCLLEEGLILKKREIVAILARGEGSWQLRAGSRTCLSSFGTCSNVRSFASYLAAPMKVCAILCWTSCRADFCRYAVRSPRLCGGKRPTYSGGKSQC